MKHKKNFNGLLESVLMTMLIAGLIAMDFLYVWFAIVNPSEGTNPIAALIVGVLFFGTLTIIGIFLLVTKSYEYWVLSDDSIYIKRLFSEKKIIKLSEIEKVEKKKVSGPFFLCLYDTYVIYSKTNTITAFIIQKTNYSDLDCKLEAFLR